MGERGVSSSCFGYLEIQMHVWNSSEMLSRLLDVWSLELSIADPEIEICGSTIYINGFTIQIGWDKTGQKLDLYYQCNSVTKYFLSACSMPGTGSNA